MRVASYEATSPRGQGLFYSNPNFANSNIMQISEEEVIESSQKPSKGRGRGRPRAPCDRKTRSSIAGMKRASSMSGSATEGGSVEVPESTAEDSAGNVSGSLFSGHQILLEQYEEHESQLRKRDEVLEQSRKAYEQLNLQTKSLALFGGSNGGGSAPPARKDVGQNTTVIAKGDVAIQTSLDKTVTRDFGAQAESAKVIQKDVGVQLSPSMGRRTTREAEVQSSLPDREPKRMRNSDAAVNTDRVSHEAVMVQTSPVERRNVGVQKYHSTRVREVGNQTSVGDMNRSVGKRNVCVQQRSSGMLELSREASLALGIELRCDPTRLHRLLMRVAARQCSSKDEDGGNESSEQQVNFTEEDPYWANQGYFMNDLVNDESSSSDSGLGEIEPRMSCSIEESLC